MKARLGTETHFIKKETNKARCYLMMMVQCLLRCFVRLCPREGALIYPPSDDVGSLGDESMLIACAEYLKKQGFKKISLLASKDACYPEAVRKEFKLLYYRSHRMNLLEKARIVAALFSHKNMLLFGADMMDGGYGESSVSKRCQYLKWAQEAGLNVIILGASFRASITPKTAEELKRIPSEVKIYARDPISEDNFRSQLGREAMLSADVAFLLSPRSESPTVVNVKEWINKKKKDAMPIIGVNPFTNQNVLLGIKDEEKFSRFYVSLLHLLKQKIPTAAFLFVSHDSRNFPKRTSDAVINAKVFSLLAGEWGDDLLLVTEKASASEIRAIAGMLDFSICGKMHFAISCLSMNIPAFSIGYLGKFKGLYSMVALPRYHIEAEDVQSIEQLAAQMIAAWEQRGEAQRKLKNIISELVIPRAKANFNFLAY